MKHSKLIIFLLGLLFLGGCSSQESKHSIEVSGSTSVAPVMNKLADEYSKSNNILININADGSSAGIKAVQSGITEIGMSSRELEDEEKNGLNVKVLAVDAIGIIQNSDNITKSLTMQQLADIYSGKIRNWKEVGGINLPIVVISREDGSGTRTAFEEKLELLNDNNVSAVNDIRPVIVNSNGAVIENVRQKKGAIGYLSVGSIEDSVKEIALDNVYPTRENVLANKYAMTRNFNLVYKDLSKVAKDYFDYLSSEQAKKIIEKEGLIVR